MTPDRADSIARGTIVSKLVTKGVLYELKIKFAVELSLIKAYGAVDNLN